MNHNIKCLSEILIVQSRSIEKIAFIWCETGPHLSTCPIVASNSLCPNGLPELIVSDRKHCGRFISFGDSVASQTINKMETFFHAYRKLNIFLFIFIVCPFLQNRQTLRFECKRRYVIHMVFVSVGYFGWVIFLGSLRLPELLSSVRNMTRVLKLVRAVGNAYASLFLVFLCILNRKSHAEFFEVLLTFDTRVSARITPPISYKRINRAFWIEFSLFSMYLIILFLVEATFNEKLQELVNLLFWSCEISEQIVYTLVICHMKNCVTNLLVRFERMHKLLRSLCQQRKTATVTRRMQRQQEMNQRDRLEYVSELYDVLFKAQRRLQSAFGSVLLFLAIYALFTNILSLYIVLNTNFYGTVKQERHRLYITIKYFVFELPLAMREVYMATYFNDIGNQVSNKIRGWRELFSDCDLLNGSECPSYGRSSLH